MAARWHRKTRSDTTPSALPSRRPSRLNRALSVLLVLILVGIGVVDFRTVRLHALYSSFTSVTAIPSDWASLRRAQRQQQQQLGAQLRLDTATIGRSPTVQAATAFLFDPASGLIFYEKSADEERSMASTTKIMTLLLAVEDGDLNQMVTVGPDAAALVNNDNSYMGLSAGEQLTLSDLLYGLVLPSGNDAAVAIADAIGGSVPSFVALMNERAQDLGLTQTFYVSPDGLDDGNHTTAHDLAVLAAVAMHYPVIVQMTSTLHETIPRTSTHKAYDLWSGNDLLSGARSPYPGALGVKPGFTYAARYCQAFAARRYGHLIVGVVLGDWSWEDRISDMRALLDWGFAQEGVPPAPAPIPWTPISPDIWQACGDRANPCAFAAAHPPLA